MGVSRDTLQNRKLRLKVIEAKIAKEGLVLTEAQVVALERQKSTDEAHGEIETEHTGYLGSQDTYYVGTINWIGRIYQQTFVDTYCKVAACKLYTSKTPITAADLLNDRVLPMLEAEGIELLRMLTDLGSEFCGRPERHDYQLFLAVNDIDHTRTKAYSPQTNGICERFHRTVKEELYEIAFRKKVHSDLGTLQADLDEWVNRYNTERTHQGNMCCVARRCRPYEKRTIWDCPDFCVTGHELHSNSGGTRWPGRRRAIVRRNSMLS
jgi:hypothetical protein